MDNESLKTL